MLLAPDSMRLRPEDREAELQPGPPPPPPRESEEEDEDDPPASEAGVAHSEDERYLRSAPAPAADEPTVVGKRPLKDPPESRVEPNMPDRVAASLATASLASNPASGGRGLLGLVPSRSLLKTSSPREAMRRTRCCKPQLTACSHYARRRARITDTVKNTL